VGLVWLQQEDVDMLSRIRTFRKFGADFASALDVCREIQSRVHVYHEGAEQRSDGRHARLRWDRRDPCL
jgi:hypothetical protein